ncbi:MAG: hypothetical protein M0038_05275 [Pseudomonadota bacterium]|jgi:hypothetical protein|nr:hypothetical protein [Pseudomonadota bacterium]
MKPRKRASRAWPLLGERSYNPAELTQCEADFRAGDKLALAHAVAICACTDIPLPEWAARAFLQGFNELREFKAKSWDDVLGQPRPKGTHASALRKRRERSFLTWAHVQRAARSGAPIDNELFERVGKLLRIGRELAKRYYVDVETRIRDSAPLFSGDGAQALLELTEAAIEALEHAEHASSPQDRAAARVRLWAVKGRFQSFFTHPKRP